MIRIPSSSTLFPYTTLFRSFQPGRSARLPTNGLRVRWILPAGPQLPGRQDRKSTRLNSSHVKISYAVFCLKKKNARDHEGDDPTRVLPVPTPNDHGQTGSPP